MTLKKGWLNRQFTRVESDVRNWPASMRQEAGFPVGQQHVPEHQVASPTRGKAQAATQVAPAKKEV